MTRRTCLISLTAALAGIAAVPWERIFEPTFEREWGGQYEGNIPGIGAVRGSLRQQDAPLLLFLETKIPNKTNQLWVVGRNDGRGIVFRSEVDEIPIRIETSSTAERLGGIVQLTNRPQKSFELKRVARWLGYRRTSGLTIRQRGISFSWHGEIPELDQNDFSRAVTDWLKADVRAREASDRKEYSPEWRERWDAWRSGGSTYRWEADLTWQLLHRSANTVSLRCQHYLYTGGAHGNTGIGAVNFRWENGALHKIRLGEYFRLGTDWRRTLAQEIITDLKQQNASWPTEEAVNEVMQRETFNESEQGLTFYFGPYEVGSYAEGEYASLVPWDKLAPYLAEGRNEGRVE